MGNTITVVATDGFYSSIGQYRAKSKLLANNKSDGGESKGLLNLLPGNGSSINPMETIKEKIAQIKDKLSPSEEGK